MGHRWVHDTLLEDTVGRLYPHYEEVVANLEYEINGIQGEIDIITRRNGHRHFYEVKSNRSERLYRKAEHQAYKAMVLFPDIDQFVLVTPGHVERITPTCHHLSGYYENRYRNKRYQTCHVCHERVKPRGHNENKRNYFSSRTATDFY